LYTFLYIGTSITAHAEANDVSGEWVTVSQIAFVLEALCVCDIAYPSHSGSKLTRLVGWWLLSQRKPASNGLVGFIQEWEMAARILKHIYLAYIR